MPLNVEYTVISGESVNLTWKPPEQRNGVIKNYVINYKEDTGTDESLWLNQKENGKLTVADNVSR